MNIATMRRIVKARYDFKAWLDRYDKWSACTTFIIVNELGIAPCSHDACFSGLGPYYSQQPPMFPWVHPKEQAKNVKEQSQAMLVGLSRGFQDDELITDEIRVQFLDWLANRSPWSEAFISKNARKIVSTGNAVLDTSVPGNLMVGGGVTMRRLWETFQLVLNWKDFVSVGVPEDLAWWLACGSHMGETFSFGRYESGHEALNPYMSKQGLLAFLSHKSPSLTGSYKTSGAYTGYSKMWGDGIAPSCMPVWFDVNFQYKGSSKSKSSSNPFAAAKTAEPNKSATTCSREHALETLSTWWPEIYKAVGFEQPMCKDEAA